MDAEPDPYGAETKLLALLLRFAGLRNDFRGLPPGFFTRAADWELFLRWAREDGPTALTEDDPLWPRLRELEGTRLPPITPTQAAREVRGLTDAIGRHRFQEHQAAVSEELAELEKELGANRLASISHETWLGRAPSDEEHSAAELVIEDLQLGLSIHRREQQEPRA